MAPGWPSRASCGLLRVEAVRAVWPHGPQAVSRARQGLRNLLLIRLDDELLDAAGSLSPPPSSRSTRSIWPPRALGRISARS